MDERDYAEERYNREWCEECQNSPCQSTDRHAELDQPGTFETPAQSIMLTALALGY